MTGLPDGYELVCFACPKAGDLYLNRKGEVKTASIDYVDDIRPILRKMELSYAERQAAWVKENDLKVGDRVKVLRAAGSCEDGWESSWVGVTMDDAVGKVSVVKDILRDDLLLAFNTHGEKDTAYFPYFFLEKATTRPMTRDEFLEAWQARGWCPLVFEGRTTLSCVSEVRDDAIVFTSMVSMFFHSPKPYRFASDNSPLTVEE